METTKRMLSITLALLLALTFFAPASAAEFLRGEAPDWVDLNGLRRQHNIIGTIVLGRQESSIAEIVEFYNRHVNEVKAADQVTIQMHDVRDMDIEVPALLRSRMPDDANDLMNRNETTTETFINGRGTGDASRHINDFLPVAGKPYVSKLQASHHNDTP